MLRGVYILPNGPTPPMQPNQSGLGWTDALTIEYQVRLTGTETAHITIISNRDPDYDAPEVHLIWNARWPNINQHRLKWDDRGNNDNGVYITQDAPNDVWHHLAICYNGSNEVSYWQNGEMLHQFTDCATLGNCDQIYLSGGTRHIREVAVHSGVKYNQPFTIKQGCRYNVLIHETI